MGFRHGTRAAACLPWVIGALLLTAFAPAPAGSEDPPPRLSLEQAVELALDQNHDVRRARENLARVEGQIQEAKSEVFPQVDLEADYFRSYDESIRDSDFGGLISPEASGSYGVRASVRQLLFSWGKVSTAIEIAKDGRRRSNQELASTVRAVKLQVHETFYRLLLDQRLVAVAEERLAQRRRQLAVAEKKFGAGVVNEFEVIRARVDLANAEPPVIRSRNQVRQSVSRLNNLMSRDQRTPFAADGELLYQPLGALTLEQVVERAVVRRPELESLRVSREIAEKAVTIARAGDKPEVNLLGSYGFAAEQAHDLGPDREKWLAGITFTLPLFDGWRTRGQVAQASSDLHDVALATSQLEETITLQAKVVLDDLTEASQIIDAAILNIDQAEKALELAETSYRYGVATALDVTAAQLSLTVAQVDRAQALHDYMVAKARVLSVMDDL
ncbi:MAG: TolC family protein [Deferrisomatales bacterium]|nr:TolC family protein [Deferrisomatales bacterium]